jgi:hypothetical protein
MANHRFADVSLGARLISVEGTNYLLSNTALFPYFAYIYRLDKAVLLSHLVLVDMTSREQSLTYFRLLNQYPRSTPTTAR